MASGQHLVSVLVAPSRGGRWREAVGSVLAQTYRPLELIVVGDGAGGAAALAARRAALCTARGAYVAFLDAGDVLLPEKIALQAAMLDENPRLGAVHCRFHDVDASGRLIGTAGRQPEGDVRAELLRDCFPWSGGPLVRRALLLHDGDHEPLHWLDDWGMWLRIALAGYDFGCVQRPLGCRRVRRESPTVHDVARQERVVLDLLARAYRRWALPAEVVVQQEQIRAAWSFRLGCRYTSAGAADAAARCFARAASLCPAWRDDPAPLLALLQAEIASPSPRLADPVHVLECILANLPPELSGARAARAGLLGRLHVVLALHAHTAGDRVAVEASFAAAVEADPQLVSAPERFAGELVAHARRLAPDDPRTLVLRVLDALPWCVRGLAQAAPLALAEVAVAETIRRHRLPGTRRRMACVVTGGAHRSEVMLRAPRRATGRLVDGLRNPNPHRRAAGSPDPRSPDVAG